MMSIKREAAGAEASSRRSELILLFAAWVVLAVTMTLLAKQNLSVPGLYYDAVFAGLAKDFVTGHVHGQHMPDHQIITFAGRPFPLFTQTYLGALKSWMLMPSFSLFGSSVAVLRSTNLFWEVIALLFLMLATWRWVGRVAAFLAGALMTFDPTFFFISVLDWGVAVPSFVCRCALLYFAVRFNQLHKLRDAFFSRPVCRARIFQQSGFRSVPDRCEFSGGRLLLAAACRRDSATFVRGGTGLSRVRSRCRTDAVKNPADGTHFYRLMNVGGVFERMYDGAVGPKMLLGIALIVSCAAFIGLVYQKRIGNARARVFLILAAVLITVGVLVLPDAVRIHHGFLVYPFPQLIIAALFSLLWGRKILVRVVAILAIAIVCGSGLRTIAGTQQLIRETGGRGRWSYGLDQFCRENANRSDLTIVSLDWGFNEQLIFLTDTPQLAEPFWEFNQTLPPQPSNPNYIYLAHPAEYSVLKYDVAYLNQLQKSGRNAEITPYFDRQNEVAFYTIRFRPQ